MMQMWTGSLGMIEPSFDKVLDGLSLLVFVFEWDQNLHVLQTMTMVRGTPRARFRAIFRMLTLDFYTTLN